MGYTTKFKGELSFSAPLTEDQRVTLMGILDEDCREHPGWGEPDSYMSYVDLEISGEGPFGGLSWNGAEKSYEMVKIVNLVTRLMRERWPDFELSGSFLAQGEGVGDIWRLKVGDDGIAHRKDVL